MSEQAVNTENAKCAAKQREEDENNPRTWKIVPAFDANEASLLLAIGRIANEQGAAAEKAEKQKRRAIG